MADVLSPSRAARVGTRVVPDFLILGAAKCGTTSLHAWLGQHPQILMSDPKEPLYFEQQYERGPEFYLSTYFRSWDGRKLLGESRHRNLFIPWVPERIKETNPDAKLIALVRNPVDRCLSHWWMRFRSRKDPLHFEDAILHDLERIRRGRRFRTSAEYATYQKAAEPARIYRTYVDTGYYAEQLKRYAAHFRQDQLRVFFFEDILSRPRAVLHEVCEFLGVESGPIADIDCQCRNFFKPMKRKRAVRIWFRQRMAGRAVAFADVCRRPAIRSEFRRFLSEHFREHNAELAKMLNRDLSHWS